MAMILDSAPPAAFGPADRVTPIRKPPGFVPAVQRWSALLPGPAMRVGFFGVRAADAREITAAGFHAWVSFLLTGHPNGPSVHDHAT